MADTDKIKAGASERGAVMLPKWLITAITGFVFALLTTAIYTTFTASNKFAVMDERQQLNTKSIEKLEALVENAATDRYTGKQGTAAEYRIRELEREVDVLRLRVERLEQP